MSQKVFSLISFVLVLCLAGNTLAATLTWDKDGGAGTRLWDNAANWDKTGPASAPTAGDTVVIDDQYTDAANGPIIQAGIDAECSILTMGAAASPAVEAVLTMTGGTLTTGGLVSLGDTVSGDYKFDLIDGSVTIGDTFALGYATGANVTFNMDANDLSITGDLFLGVPSGGGSSNTTVNINGGHIVIGEDIELAEYQGASATINISDGVVEVGDNIYVGWSQTGTATLNMTGGTVTGGTVTEGWFYIGGGYGPDSVVNLEGGTLIVPDIAKYPDTTLNIAGGTFIVGNEYPDNVTVANGWIWDPCAGDWTGTLATPGVVTVYGTDNSDIITDGNYPVGKRAVLIIDYDERNPGQTTLTADAVDANKAWSPIPASGLPAAQATGVTLSWLPGENAASHEVYFGTSFADVNDANTASDPNIYRGSGSVVGPDVNTNRFSYTVPETLVWDTTYYWRIDEVDGKTWKGFVWSVVIPPATAINPYPADDAWYLPPNVVLGWTPGAEAVTHEVYFGTSWADVNDANTSDPNVYKGPQNRDANTYDTGANEDLRFDTYYYWRIDEVNLAADVNRWKGDVWTFWVDYYLGVDDFNSYGPDPALRTVWKDYWYDTGSKNGAKVFVEADPGLVRDNQSMRYEYINNSKHKVGPKYVGSWAEVATTDLQAGTDWTIGGAKALVLYFLGDPCNGQDTTGLDQDQMWVELATGGTTALVEYPDMNAVTEDWWHEWDIDLQDFNDGGVTLSNVDTATIGFGGTDRVGQTTNGAGDVWGYPDTVYFDDIEIWPPWCRPEMVPTDFSGDCVTNYADVDIMGRDWLMYDYNTVAAAPSGPNLIGWWAFDEGSGTTVADSSAYGNDGNTISPTPRWKSGHSGQAGDYAMNFDGLSDYVLCAERDGNGPGIYDANLMPDKFTVSCWVNLDSFEYFSSFVGNGMDTGDDECGFFFYNYGWEDENGEDFGLAIRTETGMYYVETASVYQTGRWYHLASTYDGQYATVYVDGAPAAGPTDVGGPMRWVSTGSGNYPERFAIGVWLDPGYDLYVDGTIDEVRYYDYALSQGEIGVLAEFVAPGTEYYQPVPSLANITDPEIKFSRKVNFHDYRILADHWLEGPTLWPQ